MNKKLILLSAAVLGTALAHGQQLNEFEPNPSGADPADQNFELSGTALASFDLWILSIESDAGTPGTVDRASNVTGSFDANGLAVVSVPDLENPSFTVVLTDAFTGTAGTTDIDTDDDGTVDDTSAFGTILDALGVPDTLTEPLYGAQLGGTDLAFVGSEPISVFRDSGNGDWYAVTFTPEVFDAAGTVTPGSFFTVDPTESPTTFGAANPEFIGGTLPTRYQLNLQQSIDGLSGWTDYPLSSADLNPDGSIDIGPIEEGRSVYYRLQLVETPAP